MILALILVLLIGAERLGAQRWISIFGFNFFSNFQFISNSFDYLTNTRKRTFPYGTEVEVFTFSALEKAYKNSTKDYEMEHVTPYFYNNPDQFKIYDLINSEDLSSFRWTVDEINDLELVKILISKIKKRPILMNDVLKILKNEPELVKINENVKPKKIHE